MHGSLEDRLKIIMGQKDKPTTVKKKPKPQDQDLSEMIETVNLFRTGKVNDLEDDQKEEISKLLIRMAVNGNTFIDKTLGTPKKKGKSATKHQVGIFAKKDQRRSLSINTMTPKRSATPSKGCNVLSPTGEHSSLSMASTQLSYKPIVRVMGYPSFDMKNQKGRNTPQVTSVIRGKGRRL